ncbi:hypothetical protein LCGC14_0985790 [marine sediment metagenome]|uniref:Uncharacterized protein n=1 Tax=marine sediment metagenome TaxID=412755 RepID=A0A0F9NBR1_9ZZZZ
MKLKQLKEQYGDGNGDSKYQKMANKVRGRRDKAIKAMAEYFAEWNILMGADNFFDPKSWEDYDNVTAADLRRSVIGYGTSQATSVGDTIKEDLIDLAEDIRRAAAQLQEEKGRKFDWSAKAKEMRRMKIAMKRKGEKATEEEEERSYLEKQDIELRRRFF